MKYLRTMLLVNIFLLAVLVILYDVSVLLKASAQNEQIVNQTKNIPEVASYEAILAAYWTPECEISVKTNRREFKLASNLYSDNSKCANSSSFYVGVSPNGKFLAYEDLSGGVDPQVRLYSLDKTKRFMGDVVVTYGPSAYLNMLFLPNGKLALVSGDSAEEKYSINIINVEGLYTVYPNNIDEENYYFSGISDFSKIVAIDTKLKHPFKLGFSKIDSSDAAEQSLIIKSSSGTNIMAAYKLSEL